MSLVKVQKDLMTTGALKVFSALLGTDIIDLLEMLGQILCFLKILMRTGNNGYCLRVFFCLFVFCPS